MTPNVRYQDLAMALGADYYGVADLGLAHEFVKDQGGERIARYPRAIAVGMVLHDDVVNLLEAGDKAGMILYRHSSYDVVNLALDQIALRIANTLRRDGYAAFPVPASKRTDEKRVSGIFSQKLAPHLAGLGWIGKSCLLVTPDHGPRVRWVSILTDAPLKPTGKPMEPRCGECTACVDTCPPHAFTGKMFREDEPREARFNVAACEAYFAEQEKSHGVPVCGLCLYICPYGRKKKA